MGQSFFPLDFEQINNVPTITLGIALYFVRATLFDPSSKADITLPAHSWVLLHQPSARGAALRAIARGTASDANGRCVIMRPNPVEPGRYALGFTPLPPAIRKGYIANGEAWIDLATKDWADPPNSAARIERRNLLRVPAWSTIRKARAGGGFLAGPPGAANFMQSGWIESSEIAAANASPAQWDMPLDHGWVKAKVKFFFYNWKANRQEVLPPGVVVEAFKTQPAARNNFTLERVGAGTATSNADGTVYVLLEGDARIWSSCHFKFQSPSAARVDLTVATTGGPDQRLTAGGTLPVKPEERSSIAPLWFSKGMRCNFGTGSAATSNPSKIKIWDALRADIAKDAGALDTTLFFNLDDVVLCDDEDQPLRLEAKHVPATLFDHYLQIIRPDPAQPYVSDLKLKTPLIPAEQAVAIGSAPAAGRSAWGASLRLIHFEGKFHDLRDAHVTGKLNITDCVGARAAKADDHASVALNGNPHLRGTGEYEMHLVDVPGVADPATGNPLQHLLIVLLVRIEQGAGVSASARASVNKLLAEAAERWSPGHPGITSMPQTKRYALLPQDASKRGSIVGRIRAFFGEVSSGEFIDLNLEHDPSPTGSARSSNHPGWYIFDGTMKYYDSAIARDTSGYAPATDLDGLTLAWHTLAHEFGHALGLPDEYVEGFDAASIGPALPGASAPLPAFDQPAISATDYRPFYVDQAAIMVWNRLPRLRHFWHHVKTFNEDGSFSAAPARPYALVHETFGGAAGITYALPKPDSPSTYDPIFADADIANGHGECALFSLGDDEGSAHAMFVPRSTSAILPASDRFQALLVVRTRLRFVFESTIAAPLRWKLMKDFHEKLFGAQGKMLVRFSLLGAAPYHRIAVLLMPHYAYDEFVPQLDILDGKPVHLTDPADVVFRIVNSTGTPVPNPFLRPRLSGSEIRIEHSAFSFEPAMRYVLGVRTWNPGAGGKPVVDAAPLHPGDIQGLARLVEQRLGEARGARHVGVF